jgi:hypothetical protein
MSRLGRFLGVLLAVPIASFVLLVLIEGLSSFAMTLHDIRLFASPVLAERIHTQYDSELGWVNKPNVHIEDFYGPGLDFQTNSQGFRNRKDIDLKMPSGKSRIICSGDSFTLGFGVGNDDTWCAQLGRIEDRTETVNMGQGGYGLGQAFRWYERDGAKFEHEIYLLAFIPSDLMRMHEDNIYGYGKPTFAIEEGELVLKNVPVRKLPYYAPKLWQNQHLLRQLKTLQLFRLVREKWFPKTPTERVTVTRETIDLAVKIFEEAHKLSAVHGRFFAVVYLPIMRDYARDETAEMRKVLRKRLFDLGIPFIDLVGHMRELKPYELRQMYIAPGVMTKFPHAEGHYTRAGHAFIASSVYKELTRIGKELTALIKANRKLAATA